MFCCSGNAGHVEHNPKRSSMPRNFVYTNRNGPHVAAPKSRFHPELSSSPLHAQNIELPSQVTSEKALSESNLVMRTAAVDEKQSPHRPSTDHLRLASSENIFLVSNPMIRTAADKHLNSILPESEHSNDPGIPPGFCTFRDFATRKDLLRPTLVPDHIDPSTRLFAAGSPAISNNLQPGAVDRTTTQSDGFRGRPLSDDEIWQEYRRESARLKIHQRIMTI